MGGRRIARPAGAGKPERAAIECANVGLAARPRERAPRLARADGRDPRAVDRRYRQTRRRRDSSGRAAVAGAAVGVEVGLGPAGSLWSRPELLKRSPRLPRPLPPAAF